MGVRNLFKFLQSKFPSVIEIKLLSEITYSKKVVTDISSYIYKYKYTYNEKWLLGFIHLVTFFKKNGIHNTFIFDGKPPSEKDKEKEKRKKRYEYLEEKASN